MNADKWWNDVYLKRKCKAIGEDETTEHQYNMGSIEEMMQDVARLAYEAGTKRKEMQDACTCLTPHKIAECKKCGGTIYISAL